MATKKKQKEAKTARAKKLATVNRKKEKTSKGASRPSVDEPEVLGSSLASSPITEKIAASLLARSPVSGANTKRAVSPIKVEWPEAEIGEGFRRVVQDGVSPADTAIRLQCKRCNGTEEILAKEALAISGDDPPVGFPLEVFREWCRKQKKKHRRCGGASTKGVQQGLGLFERIH